MSPKSFAIFSSGFSRVFVPCAAALALSAGSPALAQNTPAAPAPPAIVDKPLVPPTNDNPGAQPSLQHVWMPGHWRWGQGSYVWVVGHWELPPVPNATWVAPQWQQQGSGYVLRDGFWQQGPITPPPAQQIVVTQPVTPPPTQTVVVTQPTTPPPQTVVVTQPVQAQVIVAPPPPPPTEVVYARPSRFHVWVPGFWAWRGGRYVWIAGHWERPPHGRRGWAEPRWERRGGNYVFIEGHWR